MRFIVKSLESSYVSMMVWNKLAIKQKVKKDSNNAKVVWRNWENMEWQKSKVIEFRRSFSSSFKLKIKYIGKICWIFGLDVTWERCHYGSFKNISNIKKLKNLIIIFNEKHNNKIKLKLHFNLKISLTFTNTKIYKCFVENNVNMEIILSRHPVTDIAFSVRSFSENWHFLRNLKWAVRQ